ncbi:MAG: TonB-dependent receptor plug domain-containing protein, partial [Muribaculaceae bacterium]|nr:TonB-dependent receptor plug domain-containing protein [Muribaculaceae bacterium]
KANLTGAVASVDVARTMDSRPVQDVTKALQGAVPGLTITTTNGGISESAEIKLRGTGTLSNNQSSAPLIVVDGVPVDNMDFLNPEDIQEISVLKDAASSAIYGARAAFGVILVTTKEPAKQDRVSISYTNNFAWSRATVLPSMASNADNIRQMMASAYRGNGSLSSEVGGQDFANLLPLAEAWSQQHGGKRYTDYVELRPYVDQNNVGDYYVTPEGNWYRYADWDLAKTLYNDATPSQKHNVSLEGTSGKTQYRASFGFDSKQGVLRFNPDKMKRYMVNVNLSTQIFSFLKAGVRVNYSQREYTDPNLSRNSYQYVWRWPSFVEGYGYIKDANGEIQPMRNDITNRMLAHTDKQVDRNTRLQGWI